MNKAIEAWDATTQGAAHISSLSLILASIYVILFFIVGAWLLMNVYDAWCKQQVKIHDAGMLAGRWLALMIFTFYFLT